MCIRDSIYSITDDNWKINNDLKEKCQNEINKVGAQISIYLGGYLVIGAEQTVLNKLLKTLPKNGKYPFQLPFHAAFHTSLLESISQKAKSIFSSVGSVPGHDEISMHDPNFG